MADYNPMPALPSGATPGTDHLGISASDMEAFNAHTMTFDESLLDPVHGLSNIPFTPTAYDFETFSTTFEDPFSYPARPFDGTGVGPLDAEAFNFDAASPQELDSKLLGFGPPVPGKATLVSETGKLVEPAMTGELYGMFFVAEDVFGADNNSGRPLELTCYRRNLWQCTTQITLPRNVSRYVDDQGRQAPVLELAASITAVESIEAKSTGLITIPWRSTNLALAGTGEETKVVSPPPVVTIDLSSQQEVDDSNRVSVPVSWKRLQFKHATANNGRRKGLQQHYVVQINLLVKTKSGEYIKVSEIQSGPVIVRGRSPRNFDNRREVPLTGDKRLLERRNTDVTSGGTSAGSLKQQLQQSQISSQVPADLAHNLQRHYSLGNVQQSTPERERATPRPLTTSTPNPQQHPNKKKAVSSPSLNRPPVPSWGSLDASSTMGSDNKHAITNMSSSLAPPTNNNQTQRTASTAAPSQSLPISLSLSEDERSPNRSNSSDSTQSPQLAKAAMGLSGGEAGASGGQSQSNQAQNSNSLTSQLETADMLYEYFPLSLDDWMPPVDAVYRPHVVHHTIVPPEVKAQQTRSKAKRYFVPE